jgi:hypothetical protein
MATITSITGYSKSINVALFSSDSIDDYGGSSPFASLEVPDKVRNLSARDGGFSLRPLRPPTSVELAQIGVAKKLLPSGEQQTPQSTTK